MIVIIYRIVKRGIKHM